MHQQNTLPSAATITKLYPFRATGPFTCKDEMMAAMSHPKYRTDEAFREAVAAKLAATEDRSSWGMAEHRIPLNHTRQAVATDDEANGW